MTSDDTLLDLAGLAQLLGRTVPWLHRHIRRLRDQHGFPRPLPVINRYDRQAVRAWIYRQQTGTTDSHGNPPSADPHWTALLDMRAASLPSKRTRQ